jgi:uncharacterized protein YxeA
MKKIIEIILVLIVLVFILKPKVMSYSGSFFLGSPEPYFKKCLGVSYTKQPKATMPDGVSGTKYCIGIPYN